ncbi:hypothetical protein ACFE04_014585 [Oxalis oulophora]
MNDETFQQMNIIECLDARNQQLTVAGELLRDNNQNLQKQLGKLFDKRDAFIQKSKLVKSQIEIVFSKVMNIRAKASMLAKSCPPNIKSPFEQFAIEANEGPNAFMVDHHFM